MNGHKNMVLENKFSITEPRLSPDENFVIWFDPDSLSYFSYEVSSGLIKNISKNVSLPLFDTEAIKLGKTSVSFDIAGWGFPDHSVYLYSNYDIWKVDLRGIDYPLNITKYYGTRNQIVFSIINLVPGANRTIKPKENLLLSGYDMTTKSNGFWETINSAGRDPVMKTMDAYSYFIGRTATRYPHATGFIPMKAKNANTFMVQGMSADRFPNLYVTNNFLSYKQISQVYPENDYNWLKAQLITWRMTDGNLSQGILYTPENFDSTKKYPLIFNYYEQRSDQLHQYLLPEYSGANMNIPFYVSNGYLVFVPDIHYHQGHNGYAVLNAVVSATEYLSKFPWVDSTKIGLQGHSFGGWETNFLITHSNRFAAACSAAGVSDLVSAYDQDNGDIHQQYAEITSQGSPFGVGVTPWTRQDLYIENSPIFYVGNVTTPLLIIGGDQDKAAPLTQGMEMFLSLRRAGKRVWLLQYENGNHILLGNNAIDYTLRMKQFFDYYLKGSPPPKWMTQGIPASMKGIDSGLELDRAGSVP
jgi:dipeptidyl aminopeptidase/acylaminoacyl peptidase